jgi:hypothetical protein
MENRDIEIDEKGKTNLLLAAKWAKIFGFSSLFTIGFILAASLFFIFSNNYIGKSYRNIFFDGSSYTFLIIVFFAIFLLLLFMFINLLLKFSKKVTFGLEHNDVHAVTEGFTALKIYFIITGVFAIIGVITSIFSFF